MSSNYKDLTYNEIRVLAKERGIKATGKKSQITKRLRDQDYRKRKKSNSQTPSLQQQRKQLQTQQTQHNTTHFLGKYIYEPNIQTH